MCEELLALFPSAYVKMTSLLLHQSFPASLLVAHPLEYDVVDSHFSPQSMGVSVVMVLLHPPGQSVYPYVDVWAGSLAFNAEGSPHSLMTFVLGLFRLTLQVQHLTPSQPL